MKTLFALMSLMTVSMISNTAFANHTPQNAYRYRTTYHEFDRGFYNHYRYTESGCNYSYRTYTCYNFERTTPVYVEERHFTGGYSRVVVYETEYSSSPYVSYYSHNGVVVRRDYGYRSHPYYGHSYYHHHWHTVYAPVYIHLDFETGWDKITTGLTFVAVGAAIAADANSDAGRVIGAAVALGGLASASSGSEQLRKESELQKSIKNAKGNGTDVK